MRLSFDKVQECAEIFHRQSFLKAHQELQALIQKKISSAERCEAMCLSLRVECEFDDPTQIDRLFSCASEMVVEAKKHKLSGALYHLGIVFLLLEENLAAEDCFRSVLDLVKPPDEEGQGYARYGLGASLLNLREMALARAELKKIPMDKVSADLKCLAFMLSGNAHKRAGNFQEAISEYVEAQKFLSDVGRFYLKNWVFYGFGTLYARLGDLSKARTFLEVSGSMTHSVEFRRLHNLIQNEISRLDWKVEILFDPATGDLVNQNGLVSLRRKPILIKLFNSLVEKWPNCVSKENLYQSVWSGEYHPLRHDGLLYSHMQRLRQVLAADPKFNDVILTSTDGYRINPDILIQIKGGEGGSLSGNQNYRQTATEA